MSRAARLKARDEAEGSEQLDPKRGAEERRDEVHAVACHIGGLAIPAGDLAIDGNQKLGDEQ